MRADFSTVVPSSTTRGQNAAGGGSRTRRLLSRWLRGRVCTEMVTPTLVNEDLERGRATVEAIRQARVPVQFTTWAHFPYAEEWRLVIVTPLADREGPRAAYAATQHAVQRASLLGENMLPVYRLTILGPSDDLARSLANTLKSSGPNVHGAVAVTSSPTTTSTGTVDVLYTDRKKRL